MWITMKHCYIYDNKARYNTRCAHTIYIHTYIHTNYIHASYNKLFHWTFINRMRLLLGEGPKTMAAFYNFPGRQLPRFTFHLNLQLHHLSFVFTISPSSLLCHHLSVFCTIHICTGLNLQFHGVEKMSPSAFVSVV